MTNKVTKINFFVILVFTVLAIFFFITSSYNFKTFIFISFNLVLFNFLFRFKKFILIKSFFVLYLIILISVYSLEILYLLNQKKITDKLLEKKISAAKEIDLNYDSRSIFQYIYDNNKLGKIMYPAIYPKDFISNPIALKNKKIIPLFGLKEKLIAHCNEGGFFSSYMSDKYGFNNPDSIWEKSKNLENIILIGDSYVHGACVNQDSTISHFLNVNNDSFKFFNLGMSGNGPLLNYATLKEFGNSLKPKKVIWFFFEGNDYLDFKNEIQSDILTQYFNEQFKQNLIKNFDEIDISLNNYYEEKFSNYEPKNLIGDIIRLNNLRYNLFLLQKKFSQNQIKEKENKILINKNEMEISENDKTENYDKLFSIFNNSKKLVASWDAEFIVFILPDYGFYFDKKAGHTIRRKNYTKIFDILNDLNIKYIDFYENLENNDDIISYFPLGLPGHYNSTGYKFIADTLKLNLE